MGAFLYFGFIASLICIPTILLYGSKIGLPPIGLSLGDGIISRMLVVLPAIWFATHLNKQINLRAKLYEVYNYKQRLTATYIGFLRQPDFQADEKSFRDKFTKKILDHINRPPSITIAKVYSEGVLEQILQAICRRKGSDETPK